MQDGIKRIVIRMSEVENGGGRISSERGSKNRRHSCKNESMGIECSTWSSRRDEGDVAEMGQRRVEEARESASMKIWEGHGVYESGRLGMKGRKREGGGDGRGCENEEEARAPRAWICKYDCEGGAGGVWGWTKIDASRCE